MPAERYCIKRRCLYYSGIREVDNDWVDTCNAFPRGIPWEILSGKDMHLNPLPGQENEIVYKRRDFLTQEELAKKKEIEKLILVGLVIGILLISHWTGLDMGAFDEIFEGIDKILGGLGILLIAGLNYWFIYVLGIYPVFKIIQFIIKKIKH